MMNTGISNVVMPSMSSYSVSKVANLRLTELITAKHPNINAVSVQPEVLAAGDIKPMFKRFTHDTLELVGGTVV